ncbi:MAG: SUMF1/EgtB/PvdO family nonheme iron enzyme [Bacteroidales bacterium]|nr:SUMF1/EgtB/PvdO family nonheme iron enzyme [Bacteroidales bacterium]
MTVTTVIGWFLLSACFSCTPNNVPPKDEPVIEEPTDSSEVTPPEDSTEVEPPKVDPALLPEMVEIPEGTFMMGSASASGADYDEAPAHSVSVSAFRMSSCEITNIQYEAFAPAHKKIREDREESIAKRDDQPVVDVSWYDAVAYCEWLSGQTGKSYRLPTEAEWEYACRAGTTTDYYTGSSLPAAMQKQQATNRNLQSVNLSVGKTDPNSFGLYDMHGNVEEWCQDWYGPYSADAQTNPGGPSDGLYKVTRGGSHNTPVKYLRSANRMAATPDDFHTQIGFRVVECETVLSYSEPSTAVPANMRNVSQTKHNWGSPSNDPFFLEPIPFVVAPTDGTPFYSHNHQPAVTWCDNGDLLAVWFTTVEENGREMEVVGSRLRKGATAWEPASTFFKVPDRNMTGSALCRLADGTLLHMNGVANSGDWQNLALCVRRSTDNGATWSKPVLPEPNHGVRHQVIAGPIILSDGSIGLCCDGTADGSGPTSFHLSSDNGFTWADQWNGKRPVFGVGETGNSIAGIHAGVVELKDGSLMAFGRGLNLAGSGKTPMSVSTDMGHNWTFSLTDWPLIGSGQRQVLLRLQEGPIMFATFTSNGMTVYLSEDEGKTWSAGKLLTDGKSRTLDGGAFTGTFTMDATHAEPKGYFCGTQTPDGTIHLLSSRIHYRFNLAWIKQ